MAITVNTLTGKVLVQIGDNEPIEVGTIEIPIQIGVAKPSSISYPPGVRGASNIDNQR